MVLAFWTVQRLGYDVLRLWNHSLEVIIPGGARLIKIFYRSPLWALGVVLRKELYQRLLAKAMVGRDGVAGEQPVGQFSFEVR